MIKEVAVAPAVRAPAAPPAQASPADVASASPIKTRPGPAM